MNKKAYILSLSLSILCLFCFSTMVWSKPPPEPPSYYYPTSYNISVGAYHSGYLESLEIYDNDYLTIRAFWYWFFGFYYTINAYFYFDNVDADTLTFGFTDNCDVDTTQIFIRYSDNSIDFYPLDGSGSDGIWVVDLDSGKLLYRVYVQFTFHHLFFAERYLNIDCLKATKYYE